MSKVIVLGAGGHAKVVADILQCCGDEVIGFLDDSASPPTQLSVLHILGTIDDYARFLPCKLILGIGSNRARNAIVNRLGDAVQHLWTMAIHPRATVASSALIGPGTVICAHAVVNPHTMVGDHAIINTGATVDHDCHIGDFAHVAPGSHLAGGVVLGEGAFAGIGTVAIPGVHWGDWSASGAGSVVIRDIPERATAYGVPAKSRTTD